MAASTASPHCSRGRACSALSAWFRVEITRRADGGGDESFAVELTVAHFLDTEGESLVHLAYLLLGEDVPLRTRGNELEREIGSAQAITRCLRARSRPSTTRNTSPPSSGRASSCAKASSQRSTPTSGAICHASHSSRRSPAANAARTRSGHSARASGASHDATSRARRASSNRTRSDALPRCSPRAALHHVRRLTQRDCCQREAGPDGDHRVDTG